MQHAFQTRAPSCMPLFLSPRPVSHCVLSGFKIPQISILVFFSSFSALLSLRNMMQSYYFSLDYMLVSSMSALLPRLVPTLL